MMRPPVRQVFQRRLRRDKDATDVDVNHVVHFLERGLLECFRNSGTGIVSGTFNLFNNQSGCVRALCIGNSHACPILPI
jgi:hypothetical protein